ncbi:MAG: IS256 family transposase [Bacteroidota bacterium]
MPIDPKLIDQLLAEADDPSDILADGGLLKELSARLIERALDAEIGEVTSPSDHLGYEKHAPEGRGSGNSRNGRAQKQVLTETGPLDLSVPRDRDGSFEPQIVPKRQRRLEGFDRHVVALYAGGMTTRQIQAHLEEMYGTEVSPALISRVTDAVLDEARAWQARDLDACYPILFLDGLIVKVRDADTRRVVRKTVYVALGIDLDGTKRLLGLWLGVAEGAGFWAGVLTDLRARGVEDVFVVCVDGLTGFSEAIGSVYPEADVQRCIVHAVRQSLRFVGWRDRKAVARALRAIYSAATLPAAEDALVAFEAEWGERYPSIGPQWRSSWEELTLFFAYPPEIRRVVYTTNAVESLNSSLRRVLKTRGPLPSDDAVLKLLYLALNRITARWTRPLQNWKAAMLRFEIDYGERLTRHL